MNFSVGEKMMMDGLFCHARRPNQMINLLLEKQTNIIYGKLSDYDDFGDWI
jgi:hypothetical protein